MKKQTMEFFTVGYWMYMMGVHLYVCYRIAFAIGVTNESALWLMIATFYIYETYLDYRRKQALEQLKKSPFYYLYLIEREFGKGQGK